MSPLLIPLLALSIPIVAILASTYASVAKLKAKQASDLREATGDLRAELDRAEAERRRLERRLQTLEAIVTDEGFELEREARRAGLAPVLDLGALPDAPGATAAERRRDATRG